VPGDALSHLGANPEAVAHLVGGEGPRLDAELDLGQRGADVIRRAGAFPVEGRTEGEAAAVDQRDVETFVRRLEIELLADGLALVIDQRADVVFVGTGIAGIELRAERYARAALPLLRGGRNGEEQRGASGQRGGAAKERAEQNDTP
jgi:hypothetical protein